MSGWGFMSLSDSLSPSMKFISKTHDFILIVVIMIISLVLYLSYFLLFGSGYSRSVVGSEGLEVFWALVPMCLLASLAVPSLHCLYFSEENFNPLMSIKAVGHQWYWSYEYSDFDSVSFDSYMMSDLNVWDVRLLSVDQSVILPVQESIRAIVSSSDVIHSWALPALGVKVDAVPGRLNQSLVRSEKVGDVFGQCSEICGSLHSFMPICLSFVPKPQFLNWVKIQISC
uniref:Cytochrome c oxidase subunit 2 n=1 Tax=Haematomyzus elephantis TaxID=160133 RepID=A0A0R5QN18_9NEOP|nr:cytochrome c oxidase subunit 2 [Haematomyzus elephantis]